MRIGSVDPSVAAAAAATRLVVSSGAAAGTPVPSPAARPGTPAAPGSVGAILDSGIPAGQALAMFALQQSGSQAEMAAQLIQASLVPTLRAG